MDHSYPYIASLTREPFLFYEMRSTAKLMAEGNSNDTIVKQIVEKNLFQYPTEKSITRMAKACIKRLRALEDDTLVLAIASQPTDVAKQICLYALMKQSRLVWEFMLTVIGEKYRLRDMSFGKIDLNTFFMRLQEQNDAVASWSDTTITKLKQIIARVLVETEYLDNLKADHLNPVWLLVPLEKLFISGVMKKRDDIREMLSYCGNKCAYTVESPLHFQYFAEWSEEHPEDGVLRLYPRLTSGNQFGMDEDTVLEILKKAKELPGIEAEGIHYFSGTQKKNLKRHQKELAYLDEFLKKAAEEQIDVRCLEYGSGDRKSVV